MATAMKGNPPHPTLSPNGERDCSRSALGAAGGTQPPSRRAARDQRPEVAGARLFLLPADDPPRGQALVVRRLRAKKIPCLLVRLESLLVRRPQPGVPPLERVHAGPLGVGLRERGQARRRHSPELLQRGHALDVHVAPDALWLPRREADAVARLVDAVAHAVDPAEAESLVDRLGPRDAGPARAFLVEADPQLARLGVVLLEPPTEIDRCREERRLRRGRHRK